MPFEAHKFVILMLIYLFFHLNYGVIFKNLLNLRSCRFTFMFSPKCFIVLAITFRSEIHFELILIYCVK